MTSTYKAREIAAQELYEYVGRLGVHGPTPAAWSERSEDHKDLWRKAVSKIAREAHAEGLREALADKHNRILGALDDYASMQPEDGETWESWYAAAFDLARQKIAALVDAPTASEPRADVFESLDGTCPQCGSGPHDNFAKCKAHPSENCPGMCVPAPPEEG